MIYLVMRYKDGESGKKANPVGLLSKEAVTMSPQEQVLHQQNSAGFGCLPVKCGKCVYKEETNAFPQLYRTFLNSSTLFYFQTEERYETDCSLC